LDCSAVQQQKEGSKAQPEKEESALAQKPMIVTCRKAISASQDKTFPTNPYTLFILAHFLTEWQGYKV
jgi:hypothetical protein